MKLLVCVSQTPDTTAKIKFTADNSQFDKNGVQFIMNPYDEWYALVRALELKEQVGGTVTLLHVGPKENEAVIRKGLAIGADNAVRIDAEAKSSLFVAKQIAEYAKAEGFDLLFFGKETIDYNGSEVPAMVSEYLDLPFVSYGIEMSVEGTTATVQRDIEGGKEVLTVDTPFVLSCAKGMAEQRIPNMRGIMMAKRKPIKVVPAVEAAVGAELVSYAYPPEKGDVKLIDADNMDELVQLLHNEAKVI
ncbi:electron transfer flavoprotein subunit beta/FixA family protein [Saprospira grandis]|nr:electron transfer flavoprotein subunit beta/FixA family protein [Saprospira grandis]WBM73807.1 electron transfer flavoprotein subunit beta/FixA family protein [Saprospira grandis]